jgi:hypothetical protein
MPIQQLPDNAGGPQLPALPHQWGGVPAPRRSVVVAAARIPRPAGALVMPASDGEEKAPDASRRGLGMLEGDGFGDHPPWLFARQRPDHD